MNRYIAASLLLLPTLWLEHAQSQEGIMYIGDSLTHGYSSSSYRWHLHKVLVDAGYDYEELGIHVGNTGRNQLPAGSSYRGVAFQNRHCAQSSARAWEIAGAKVGPRFGGSKLDNWLGLDAKTADAKSYQGIQYSGDDVPDSFVLMIGTNDLLSDNEKEPKGLPSVATREIKELLSHVEEMYQSMRKSNPKASIYLTTVPAWGSHRSLDIISWRKVVHRYNQSLARWSKGREKLTLVDVNRGLLVDGLKAHPEFFLSDGLHFNEQGNLLIAGNIARAMGISPRTAGLQSRRSDELSTIAPASKDHGMSVELKANNPASYRISNGRNVAEIEVTKTLILWRNGRDQRVIYADDLRKNHQLLRLVWVQGDAQNSIDAGYYVWLGTQLIGEALPSSEESGMKAVSAQNGSLLAPLCDLSGSYAPR